jgi:hypothetical protein
MYLNTHNRGIKVNFFKKLITVVIISVFMFEPAVVLANNENFKLEKEQNSSWVPYLLLGGATLIALDKNAEVNGKKSKNQRVIIGVAVVLGVIVINAHQSKNAKEQQYVTLSGTGQGGVLLGYDYSY